MVEGLSLLFSACNVRHVDVVDVDCNALEEYARRLVSSFHAKPYENNRKGKQSESWWLPPGLCICVHAKWKIIYAQAWLPQGKSIALHVADACHLPDQAPPAFLF